MINRETLAARETIRQRIEALHNKITEAGGDPGDIEIVAVTKGFGPDTVRAALGAGLVSIGENFADELVDKAELLAQTEPKAAWHFLGSLQSNKINRLLPFVNCWQSVDSVHRVEALAKRSPGATILIQVRLDDGAGRAGAAFSETPDLVARSRDLGLVVRGLMGVAPIDPQTASSRFAALVRAADGLSLPVRSIGMSDDFELAVRAGSTMIRIGTALFGRRKNTR